MYIGHALITILTWIAAFCTACENAQQFVHGIARSHNDMHIGIKAVSLTRGTELCSLNEQCRFTPASNTKIFTAILALEYLGPEYRFEAQLITDGAIQDSVLHGSLYLKASGDPSLKEEDLVRLIAKLHDQHITTITGDFCIDITEFDDDIFQPGSFFDNVGYAWNPPTTALSIDGKAAYVVLPYGGVLVADEKLQATAYNLTTELRVMLQNSGITLHGNIALKSISENAYLLAIHQSEPLSVLVQHMMKNSDNLYADCIFKKVGAALFGAPGSWKKGYEALKQLLKYMCIHPHELVIRDGSGRSRYNLIAPAHIITALQWAYQWPYFQYLFESLAIAGSDGTLKDRMKELDTCVRGKTGTLSGVSALSGYLCLPHDVIAFSILENGYVSQSVYNAPCKSEIEDAFCAFLFATEKGTDAIAHSGGMYNQPGY